MKWPWSKPPRTRLSPIDVLKKYKGYSWDSFCKYATMEDLDDFITGGV